jgi:Putative adhesin
MEFSQYVQESAMSETIEKTFTVSSPARLSVNNIRGSLEVHPGEEGVIQVTAVKKSHSGDDKCTRIEIAQEADGTVKAATHYPDGGWTWMFGSQPCEVDYIVKAPHMCSLRLNGMSNTVLAEGFNGEVNVNSVSGEITLRDLKGSMRIHTVSGDANAEHLSGFLDVDSVSGEVVVTESSLSSIKGKTVSGDMRISIPMAEGPYDFKSVSGDVRLTMPPDTQCTGELQSLSGDLVSAFPTTGYSSHHGSQSVHVQGGGVKITLKSVSGDLTLDCDGEIPRAPEPLKTISSEDRRTILERVEHGELTVEQALDKLHT